jgi:RND family efflux transporter MFP subunit
LEPSSLVKREPQIASAEAAVLAARGAVAKAERDVERTSIRAPYACRIERTHVDLGAVLAPGMPLVDLVSRGAVEVRLALSLEDYGYLKRDEDGRVTGTVTASGEIGGKTLTWTGALVRSEEIVERGTRSLNVVAEFGREGGEVPLIGMFVKAVIDGISLPNVVEVPRAAMLNGSEVLMVDAEGKLEFRRVEVMRTAPEAVIVTSGLKEGERMVITPPSTPMPGVPVKVMTEPEEDSGEEQKEKEPKPADEVAGAPRY